jgi:hypothetical protein
MQQNKQRSKAESDRLQQKYQDYIKELRRLRSEKYGEQLCFEFEGERLND